FPVPTYFSLPFSVARLVPHPFPTRRSSDLPLVSRRGGGVRDRGGLGSGVEAARLSAGRAAGPLSGPGHRGPGQTVREVQGLQHADRKSTRLNSSHEWISYAVFCLKKKKRTS